MTKCTIVAQGINTALYIAGKCPSNPWPTVSTAPDAWMPMPAWLVQLTKCRCRINFYAAFSGFPINTLRTLVATKADAGGISLDADAGDISLDDDALQW